MLQKSFFFFLIEKVEEITKVTNNIRVDNMKLFSFKFKEKKRKKKSKYGLLILNSVGLS